MYLIGLEISSIKDLKNEFIRGGKVLVNCMYVLYHGILENVVFVLEEQKT